MINRTVCLSKCTTHSDTKFSAYFNNVLKKTSAIKSLDVNAPNFKIGDFKLKTAIVMYDTKPLFGRICFPYSKKLLETLDISKYIDIGALNEYFSDLKLTWPIILASAFIALAIGYVYMVLVKYCAGVITWISILIFICLFAAIGYLSYDYSKKYTTDPGKNATNEKVLKVIAYIFWAIAALSILYVLCVYSKIRLAIAIIKAAAEFVKSNPLTLLIPIVFGLITIAFWAYWIATALYVYSVGDISGSLTSPFASVTWNKKTRYSMIYFIFGGLWKNAFLMGFCQFVLASTVCIWYFAQEHTSVPIGKSVYRGLRYHMGSIAFGALLLAIVQFIRLILEYISNKAKMAQSKDSPNKIVTCIISCLKCYMACFQRFIEFLNKNAYIQVALTGKNFCSAAKDGFFLIIRNPMKFALVATIGELFIFIGKFFISLITTLICYLIITKISKFSDNLFSPFFPSIIFFVISYTIAVFFMSVYGMAASTILQCYLVDVEICKEYKGSEIPEHAPDSLKQFVEANVK